MISSGDASDGGANIDFVCVGAQKSGTTFITSVFRSHPQIQLPTFKELYFFSSKGEYKSAGKFAQSNADKDLNWYRKQFTIDKRKKGEISTHYLLDASSAEKIKQAFPDVRIFAVLRNPSERAFSQYIMERYKTGKESRELLQIIQDEPGNEIIARGFYHQQLR